MMTQEIATTQTPPPVTAMSPFEPRSLSEAERLAERLSRSGLMPEALRGKADDVLVIILSGHDLGLSAMQAIRAIHVIKGRPVMAAELLVALVHSRRDVCRYFRLVESTDERAAYETLRVHDPKPTPMEWTLAQAQKAGLTKKDIWQAYGAAMLRARCAAALVRAVYPDLALGVTVREELDAYDPREPMAPPSTTSGSGFIAPPPRVDHRKILSPEVIRESDERKQAEDDEYEATIAASPLESARAALVVGDFDSAVYIASKLTDEEKALFRVEYREAKARASAGGAA